MNIKSLLLGSAAALVAASGAQAADAIVAPEPEAVEYVRVCDAYGAGYFYIPGTETCLRIHGYVRYDASGGDRVYARTPGDLDRDTWGKNARATLRFSTASETELGTLKTFTELRYNWNGGGDGEEDAYGSSENSSLRYAYIQLGGLRVGLDESAFVTFPGYLGNVINDDVILAGGYRTNLISYTFTGGNGFSAILSLEEGGNGDSDVDVTLNDYTPHIVGGLKYAGGWGSIAAVAAYDARNEEWAGKVRGDVNITDRFSVWVQGGYKSNDDTYAVDGAGYSYRVIDSFYGTWGGDWAVWGGAAFKATEKATFNLQLAYDDTKTFAATANVAYELVPGFTITPEVSYTKWDDENISLDGEDAFQGMIRFQRSF
ncbi:porin [Brucella anthropi]|jgi:Porin subfamily|uniref:Porin n=3 Tax=Brucella anthropi TaxID=529 RepID=A0A011TS70_BRUAN|nr:MULTISPECIES: porin [Brucella/Ochrobactrum group]QOD64221.1 porin [Ochrobactrum sp. MT180101]QTN02269.1 porin [Ochrobactrum sp. EEELCW01]RNL41193.1 porin [Ochrobactrum sp. MH181795]EXL06942.1 porin [Brucella anthropi]KAB2746804.1 porin [Brucella anthropi]